MTGALTFVVDSHRLQNKRYPALQPTILQLLLTNFAHNYNAANRI